MITVNILMVRCIYMKNIYIDMKEFVRKKLINDDLKIEPKTTGNIIKCKNYYLDYLKE